MIIFGFSDSFWGSLFGALLTGIFAILVWVFQIISETNKGKKIKNNIEKVIEISYNDLDEFSRCLEKISKYKSKDDEKDRLSYELFSKLDAVLKNNKILSLFTLDILFYKLSHDDEILKKTHYISAYREVAELLNHYKDQTYGTLFITEKIPMDSIQNKIDLVKRYK